MNRFVFQRVFKKFLKVTKIFRQTIYYRFFLIKQNSSKLSSFHFSFNFFIYSTEHFSNALNSLRFRIYLFIINRDEIEHRDDIRSISSILNCQFFKFFDSFISEHQSEYFFSSIESFSTSKKFQMSNEIDSIV